MSKDRGRTSYIPAKPHRESPETIGITDGGDEVALPGLVAGPGGDHVDPEIGTPEWEAIIQAGLDSAAAAEPPNGQEIALWTRVAEERLPLEFVTRNDATLTLRVPTGWMIEEEIDREIEMLVDTSREIENAAKEDAPGIAALSLQANLSRLFSHAMDEAGFTVTVSRHTDHPIHHGSTFVYPREVWGAIVVEVVEQIAAHLLPEEDGVVIGQVQDEDAVLQALELLAKATGGGASAE